MGAPQESSKHLHDLTKGSVAGNLIRFALPFLLSMFIQQSYSLADLIIVSHFAGEASVAGVNNGTQLTLFPTVIAIGFSVGGTILIGQYFGAKRMEDVRKTASTLLTTMLIAAVNVYKEEGIDIPTEILVKAQDIDPLVGMMCYIQLFLPGCAGCVKIGNSDSSEPIPKEKEWILPGSFRQEWVDRGYMEHAKPTASTE